MIKRIKDKLLSVLVVTEAFYFILLLLFALMTGCKTPNPKPVVLLARCDTPNEPQIARIDVEVPEMFRHGVGWLGSIPSDYERYLEAFRRGYWSCIMNYMQDINYVSSLKDYTANGWGSEVSGYSAGYEAAEIDMQTNLKRFGKDRTAQYLKYVWNGGF